MADEVFVDEVEGESVKANWRRYALGESSGGEITDLRQLRSIVESALLPHEVGERRRMVNDGVIAEAASGLSRAKLNELKDLCASAEDCAEIVMPVGVYPKHFGPDLVEFLGCHTGPKLVSMEYRSQEGVAHVALSLDWPKGAGNAPLDSEEVISGEAGGEDLGECSVDGESLVGSEPSGPEVLPPSDTPTERAVDAGVASPVDAPLGTEGPPSDSRPEGNDAGDEQPAG